MPESETRDPPIKQVDKYEVLSLVGEGGMASVFAARLRAPGGASKQVALKLIQPHLSEEPEFVGMFLNEMRVAMAMSHRNVVQTFDAGKHDSSYYMVMELMDGGSVSSLIRRPAPGELLPLDIVLFIATEVCAALEYAHGFQPEGDGPGGVVHRDVSPGNILLSSHGDVKLADFGVAKAAGRITSSFGGMIKGKLTYMAPEQARGEVGPASDLFALGAVLYRMVAGVPLRANPSLAEVRVAGAEVRLPRDCRPEVSRSLEQLITRCLSHAPEQRPRSAAELRERLAEEQEWVRRRQSPGRDPHARLREYLGLGASAGEAGPQDQARRMADAIKQAALAVPTQVGHERRRPAAAPAVAAPVALPDDPPVEPGATQVRGGGPGRLGLVIIALILMAAAGGILWWTLRAPPAVPINEAAPRLVMPADGAAPRVVGLDAAPASPDQVLEAAPGDAAQLAPDAAARSPRRVKRPPRRARRGKLDLNAAPWARVYLGRRKLGETPLQGVPLPAGRHRLRLVNPQRKLTKQITVQIRAGRTTRRSVRLAP